MIEIDFYKNNNFFGFKVSGHANYGDYGEDIVCAGVSSAVQLTINTITEILKIKAKLTQKKNLIKIDTSHLNLDSNLNEKLQVIYEGLYLQLSLLSEDYSDFITINVMEV